MRERPRATPVRATPVRATPVRATPVRATPTRDLVWIVDDSPLEVKIARGALEPRFRVETFADGESMLERLALPLPPDLILLDWQMPGLSGVDVCRFVRQTIDGARLPIVLLTAMRTGDDLVLGLASGANDFVTKPFLPEELIARVGSLIRTKRLHEKLERAEEALRVEGEVRERFIGILGHDLRQPLNALLIAGHILAKGARPEDEATTRIVVRSSQRMQRMIAELLDFTRIRQGGGIPVNLQDGDLHRIVGHVIEELRLTNPQRRVTLSITGRAIGRWDHDRIAQVCANLIGNALEHSPQGTPVDVTVQERADGVELAVTNEGPAIVPTLRDSIFDPFRRGARTNAHGLGLGLFIAERIVSAHAGTISVESDDDATCFRVRLPLG